MLWVSDQYAKEKLEDVGERENANSILHARLSCKQSFAEWNLILLLMLATYSVKSPLFKLLGTSYDCVNNYQGKHFSFESSSVALGSQMLYCSYDHTRSWNHFNKYM